MIRIIIIIIITIICNGLVNGTNETLRFSHEFVEVKKKEKKFATKIVLPLAITLIVDTGL